MDEDPRPAYSPYLLITVPLQFKDGRTLHIAPHLLSQSPKLEAMYLENRLNFPDVCGDVGHVIIHYLYTGTYESLQPEYSGLIKAFATEFSTSVRAYNAAKTYRLPELAELARHEVERLGGRLQVSHVFDILQQVCPNPDAKDVWLGEFLKNRVKSFLRDGFLKPLQSRTAILHKTGIQRRTVPISHVLFKGMLELFRESEASLRTKAQDTFEVAAGDVPGFPLASRYLFAKPVVEPNLCVGELEGSLFEPGWVNKKKGGQVNPTTEVLEKNDPEDKSTQEIGTSRHEETERGYGSGGPLNEKEGKEQASPKTQQQVNRDLEQVEKEAGEQINQDTAKVAEEAIFAEEAAELARLIKARANSLWGLDESEELRLYLLHARAKEHASCKSGESVKGKRTKGEKDKKGKRNCDNNIVEVDPLFALTKNLLTVDLQAKDNNDKEDKDDLWVSHGQDESKGKQKMDRDSEPNDAAGQSSDNDSTFGLWQNTKLDDDGEYLKEEGWSFWPRQQ
ncbi:hypothetical protein V8C34DRAFT_290384 [Trichoderma compactum]